MRWSLLWWCLWAVVCWPSPVSAHWTRWQLGAELSARASERVVLADGRLLECSSDRCETQDLVTGQRSAVPGAPGPLTNAVALDDGTVLLASGRLFEPKTGALTDLPAPGRDLGRLRGVATSRGRAVFWSPHDVANCRRLLVFHGRTSGFRELEAARGRACVEAVHDVGDGRALVTTRLPLPSGYDLSFAIYDLGTGRWQSGPRLSQRFLLSAFGYAGGALVFVARDELVQKGSNRVEAWFLANNGERRSVLFERRRMDNAVARLGEHEFVLFDPEGSYLWDARNDGRVRPLAPPPSPRPTEGRFARSGDRLVWFDASRKGYTLTLSLRPLPADGPCDRAFDYARAVTATELPQAFSSIELERLLPDGDACYTWLDRQERFPSPIHEQLESLLSRSEGPPPTGEVVAASLLCALQPSFASSAVATLSRSALVARSTAGELCRRASERAPVLAAVHGGGDVGATLLSTGLVRGKNQAHVAYWVVPLLHSRSGLRRYAAPLLHAARLLRASGYDSLRALLCEGETRSLPACPDPLPSEPHHRASRNARALTRFAIVTGVVGGLGTLAYVGRDDDLGRAIAIGSGAVAGAGAGFTITLATGKAGSESSGLGTILVAIPVSVLTGIAGGLVAGKTSEEPGVARFASAAVPLGLVELATVVITLDDL